MNWFPSLRRTPTVAPSTASRRRFFAGAGAVAGGPMLPSGVYVVRLTADARFAQTQRLTLVR